MNNTDKRRAEPAYRTGAVSRLTGIAPDTLRVWERRYGTLTPFRSETGTRFHSQCEVEQLTLIKPLVDGGNAISCVVNLRGDELEERARGRELPQDAAGDARPCRVAVLGAALAGRLGQELSGSGDVDVLGCFSEKDELLAEAPLLDPDILVLEYETIQPEQIREIGALLLHVGAARVVVVYSFSARATLERLESPRIFPIRGPVDAAELHRWIRMFHARLVQPVSLLSAASADISGPLPLRRSDNATLATVAADSVTVRCECPHHLVDLISRLTAFEAYSEDRHV